MITIMSMVTLVMISSLVSPVSARPLCKLDDFGRYCCLEDLYQYSCPDKVPTKAPVILVYKSKGDSCTSSEQCKGSLYCVNSRCDCNDDQYFESPSSCYSKKSKGGQCSSEEECHSTLACLRGSCDCTSSQYYDYTCKDRVPYAAFCTKITGQCQSPLSCQMNKCGCPASQKYDSVGNVCTPLDKIKVVLSQPTKRFTTQVDFIWIADAHGLQVSYKIEWMSQDHPLDKGQMTANKDGVLVTGLTPGREYEFTITSMLTSQNDKFVTVLRTLETLPASPGLVNLATSELDNPPYVLRFQPSEGDVSKYNITLSDGSTTNSTEIYEPEVQYSGLSPSSVYFYTIVAINKNGDCSESVIGNFKTGLGNGEMSRPTSLETGGAHSVTHHNVTKYISDDHDPSNNMALIAGATAAAVVVVVVIGVIIACVVLKKMRSSSKHANSSGPTTKDAKLAQEELEKGQGASKLDNRSCNNRSSTRNIYDEIPEDGGYTAVNETIPDKDHPYANFQTESHLVLKTANYENYILPEYPGEDDKIC